MQEAVLKENIRIVPFEEKYADACAQLLGHLWKRDPERRRALFRWKYLENPNRPAPLCLIALNEKDEVIAFRGYTADTVKMGAERHRVAKIADMTVHPSYRRRGLFERMTRLSADHLYTQGVGLILGLSPSWPTYYGYQKIGGEELSPFKSLFRFGFISGAKHALSHWFGRLRRPAPGTFLREKTKDGYRYVLSDKLDPELAARIMALQRLERPVGTELSGEALVWHGKSPAARYVYAYACNPAGEPAAFFLLRTTDGFGYQLGCALFGDDKCAKELFRFFSRTMRPSVVAVWSFALAESRRRLLKKLGFWSIPFLWKMRKNPPVVAIRTDARKKDWDIGGVNIRDIGSWEIDKLDNDSF